MLHTYSTYIPPISRSLLISTDRRYSIIKYLTLDEGRDTTILPPPCYVLGPCIKSGKSLDALDIACAFRAECNGLSHASAVCIAMRCRQHKTSCHTWGDRQPTPGYSRTSSRLSGFEAPEEDGTRTRGAARGHGGTERDVKTTTTANGKERETEGRGEGGEEGG